MPAGAPPRSLLASKIVGREELCALLESLLAPARGGEVIELVGDAGMGKTRLARFAVERAQHSGRRVIVGRADPDGRDSPLGLIQDALRDERRRSPALHAPADALAGEFPLHLLPELGGAPERVPDTTALFEAATRYCAARAQPRGLLLVLEDLHWADATSLELVRYFARAVRQEPLLLLLVTHRPEPGGADAPLAALRRELRRERLGREIALAPLTPDEAGQMLADILGMAPDPDGETELVRLAGGNPFVLEELVRAAVDSKRLDPSSGSWTPGALPLPWSLSDLIESRLHHLEPDERDLLAFAALVGERFDLNLVGRASGRPEACAQALAESLCRAGLWVEEPAHPLGQSLAFRHALTREVILGGLLVLERRREATRLLAAAEELAAERGEAWPPEELLRFALGAGDRARSLTLSRQAAGRALELCAYVEARAHYERALALWRNPDGAELRAQLLSAQAGLLGRVFQDESALVLADQARLIWLSLGCPAEAALALATRGEALVSLQELPAGVADLERALAELPSRGAEGARLRILTALARALGMLGEEARARRAAEEGLAVRLDGGEREDAIERIRLLLVYGAESWGHGSAEQGTDAICESLRLAHAVGDVLGEIRARRSLALWLADMRSVEGAREHAVQATVLAERHGLGRWWSQLLVLGASVELAAGRRDAGARLLKAAQEQITVSDDPFARRFGHLVGAQEALMDGRAADARVAFGKLLAEHKQTGGGLQTMLALRRGLATACLDLGDPESAREAVEPALSASRAGRSLPVPQYGFVLVAAAEAAAARQDGAELERLAVEMGVRMPGPRAAYGATLAGLTGGHFDEAALAATLDGIEAIGRPFQASRACLFVAERLLDLRYASEAAAGLALRAYSGFSSMGIQAWWRRSEIALRRSGGRLPRRPASEPDGGITAREREVLGLLVDGLSNRQIAECLVISPSTTVRHVANLFAKLGVHNRAQAVRVALERGLVLLSDDEPSRT